MTFNNTNNKPDVAAIIFDCDGVLIDNEHIIIKEAVIAMNNIGLNYTQEKYLAKYLGKTLEVFIKELNAEYTEKFSKAIPEKFIEELLKNTSQKLNVNPKPMSNIHNCLQKIHIPIAVASSSAQNRLQSKLSQAGLLATFQPHVYSGDQVKRSKPYPDLFLFAADKLNISPRKCIAIEDSVNGVKSAHAAGMYVVGFTGGSHCLPGYEKQLKKHGASIIIKDMNQLTLQLNI